MDSTRADERRRAAVTPCDTEARFRGLVRNGPDIVAVCDARGAIRSVSPSLERVLGFRPDALCTGDLAVLLHPDEAARVQRLFHEAATRAGAVLPLELRLRDRAGGWRHIEAVLTNLLFDPEVRGILIKGRDVTDRRRREEELRQCAVTDPVTGLPNRPFFADRLEQAVARARRTGSILATALVDVDRFQTLNEELGWSAADTVLASIGQRLADCLRGTDTITRVGGDEFALLLENLAGESGSRHVAERVIDALRQPFTVGGQQIAVTGSVGISVSAPGGAGAETLMRQADAALYQAKVDGRAGFVVFDPQLDGGTLVRLERGRELRRSLEQGDLCVHYQPEVDLLTHRIVGVEALVRWQHPERGLIAPAEFIPFAEETGLILSIDLWVLEEACRQAVAWQSLYPGGSPLTMSVNLSARQFQRPDLPGDVARILAATGLDPAALRLEITESAVMTDMEKTLDTLHSLRALGVELAMDDFGTGYASLSYLRRFPVSTLKIDREFAQELDHDAGAESIVRAVTALGHGLGMAVTLEGIETPGQYALARELNCDRGQGNYFWEALPGDAITELLRDAARV